MRRDLRLHFIDLNKDVAAALALAFSGVSDVTCVHGDILAVASHAIVSPANSYGLMDGGIDAAYSGFFGPRTQMLVREAISRRSEGYLPVGASLAIRTGHPRIPFLIVAPTMLVPEEVPAANAYRAMRAILRLIDAEPELAGDIYCPGLATGVGRVQPADAAREIFKAVWDWRAAR